MALQLKANVDFTSHNEGTNRSKRPGRVGDVGVCLVCLECLGRVLTALAGTHWRLQLHAAQLVELDVSHTSVPVREDYAK